MLIKSADDKSKRLALLEDLQNSPVLDEDLPETYDRTTFKQKCDNVYELIVDYAMKGRKWAA